jgi:hypothetical protein
MLAEPICTARSQHVTTTRLLTAVQPAAGMSSADYLPPRSAGQQEWQQQPQQQQQQQQQQPGGSGLMPAVQPKLAPQYCAGGPDAVADPLASLLLDDDGDGASAGGSSRYVSAGGADGDADDEGVGTSQQQQATALA